MYMSRNIDVSLIRTFLAVSETGGTTRAAGALNLTQGAVSQQIKRLEELLGKNLFSRRNKTMKLTAEGERLMASAYRFLSLNDQIWQQMTTPEFSGEIRLGVPPDIVRAFMPPILRTFCMEYPGILVTLVSDTTPVLLESLRNKEIDLTLTTESIPGNREELLLSDRLVWIGAMNGEAHNRNPLPVSLGSESCAFRSPSVEALNRSEIDWRPVCQIGSLEPILASVESDMAVAAYLSQVLPDKLTVIDSRNKLPELPRFYINLRMPKRSAGSIADRLAQHIRQGFANRYFSP